MQTLSADIYTKLVSAKLFIDRHFDEAVDLETVASNAHLSSFHFHRLFTKVYHITPHQYLTKKRLQKAKELLKTNELSIAGICTDIGFESHGSFSSLFKKHHGLAPRSYRNKVQEQKEKAAYQPACVIPHCFIAPHSPEEK